MKTAADEFVPRTEFVRDLIDLSNTRHDGISIYDILRLMQFVVELLFTIQLIDKSENPHITYQRHLDRLGISGGCAVRLLNVGNAMCRGDIAFLIHIDFMAVYFQLHDHSYRILFLYSICTELNFSTS